MGSTTALAPGLSCKLKKLLETRTDTQDLLSSLNILSSFYTENTPPARRNLRSTIEKRSIQINHEFLLASNTAQQALDKVEEEVIALANAAIKEDGELPTESLDVAPTNVVASSQATEKTDATSEVIAPTPAKPKYSRLLAGSVSLVTALKQTVDNQNISFLYAAKAAGYAKYEDFSDVFLNDRSYFAFVELHIEQGPILENEGISIGIVTAIAAPASIKIDFGGNGGHAGATLHSVPEFIFWSERERFGMQERNVRQPPTSRRSSSNSRPSKTLFVINFEKLAKFLSQKFPDFESTIDSPNTAEGDGNDDPFTDSDI